jgi:hypothetical protein
MTSFIDLFHRQCTAIANGADSGGVQALFNQKQFEPMSTHGRYIVGCNFFWLTILHSATLRVPIQRQAVDAQMDRHFHATQSDRWHLRVHRARPPRGRPSQ